VSIPSLTYLSLGAGVQSGTLVEMIVDGQLPLIDVVIFADTGDEPDYVYKHVDYLRSRLSGVGIPLETVTKGNIVKDAQGKGGFAAIPVFTVRDGKVGKLRRQCTREYKIEPIEKLIRQQLLGLGKAREYSNGAIHVNKDVEVVCWLGLSLDEVQRMKPSRMKWIKNQWPLIDLRMTRHDCKLWLRERNLFVPSKSACRICPFHNDRHFRDMRDNHPLDWEHVVAFDHFLRSGNSRFTASAKGALYLHHQCVPLDDVDLSTPQDHGQLEMFDECDDGYCFV